MSRTHVIILASTLLVLRHATVPRLEAPLTLFAHERLRALVRTKTASGGFTGTYKDRYSSFGSKGGYYGRFSGATVGKKTNLDFSGRSTGRCDTMGMSGRYTADYSGNAFSVIKGKTAVGNFGGRFGIEYNGNFAGEKAFAKCNGSFEGQFGLGRLSAREEGRFHMRVGGKRVKSTYIGSFDGKTFAAAISGTIGGKKFSFKYEVMLEGFMDYIENEGEYTVMIDGERFSGKYNSRDTMLPRK